MMQCSYMRTSKLRKRAHDTHAHRHFLEGFCVNMKAFISYSHRDESALDRLHTHLAMLRREKRIDEWYDREILAGGDVDDDIAAQLEKCDVFLALVSPDFLHSNYCYEREMLRAIERHEAGDLRIIPIIVEPCDWKASPLQRFKALPKDGKPISEWTNENTAYLDIVAELRRIIQYELEEQQPTQLESTSPTEVAGPSKYRVRRDFDEIDRGDFRRTAFQEISDYFERSITEIDQIDGLRGRFHEAGPQGFTCTVVNQMLDSRGEAHITVRLSSGAGGFGDISYSFTENAAENTANGWFSVGSNDYDLYLCGNSFGRIGEKKQMSPQNAAEALWGEFLDNTGISYD